MALLDGVARAYAATQWIASQSWTVTVPELFMCATPAFTTEQQGAEWTKSTAAFIMHHQQIEHQSSHLHNGLNYKDHHLESWAKLNTTTPQQFLWSTDSDRRLNQIIDLLETIPANQIIPVINCNSYQALVWHFPIINFEYCSSSVCL